jgi:hypothetical protein
VKPFEKIGVELSEGLTVREERATEIIEQTSHSMREELVEAGYQISVVAYVWWSQYRFF